MPVGNGIYIVKCTKTGGEFSSKMWLNEAEKNNICPCCHQEVSE